MFLRTLLRLPVFRALRRVPVAPVVVLGLSPALVLAGPASPAYAFAPAPVSPVSVPSTLVQAVNDAMTDEPFGQIVGGALADGGGGAGLIGVGGGGGGGWFGAGSAATAGLGVAQVAGVAILGLGIGYAGGTMLVKGFKWAFGSSYPRPNFDILFATSSGKCWVQTLSGVHQIHCSVTYATHGVYHAMLYAHYADGSAIQVGNSSSTSPLTFVDSGTSCESDELRNGSPMTSLMFRVQYRNSAGAYLYGEVMDLGVPNCAAPVTDGGASAPTVSGSFDDGGDNLNPPVSPLRHLVTTATCVDLTTGASRVVTASSADFYEGDSSFPQVPDAACGSTEYVQSAEVDEVTNDGSQPTKKLYHFDPMLSWGAFLSAYPDCAQSACLLDVKKKVGDTWLSCTAGDVACAGWYESPTVSTDYECTWGSYVVALSECETYRRTFDDPTATPTTYDTPVGTQPGPGSSSAPTSGVNPSPGDGSSCLSGMWSWNPVDWVYTPVKCALQWAFVPPDGSLDSTVETIQADWNSSAVGVIAGAVGGVVSPIAHMADGPSDCLGPDVNVPHFLPGSSVDQSLEFHPFAACDDPAKMLSGYWIPIANLMTYLGGFLICLRILGSTIGLDTPFDADPGTDVT